MDPFKYVPSDSMQSSVYTSFNGAPVFDQRHSLTLGGPNGTRGPVLLEDYQLIESLAHFERERIPERRVHARGAGAHGFFEVTSDLPSTLTFADVFQPGSKCPVFVRFSTVIHERASPETLRDPRGFAVKFYTKQGNWDMVGNNFPVFFIRNGHDFGDLVRAFSPSPHRHSQEPSRILDFLSFHPESCHMLTFLLDDLGIPASYQEMDGSGVHTFVLLTKEGRPTYCKFHWRPKAGVRCLLDAEAVQVGGTDSAHATRALFDAIQAGNFPEWKLFMQTMQVEDEFKYDFDPLDVTKTWPESQFPMKEIGRMVLNRNPDNFFNVTEQAAFCPTNIVPGLYYSDDKMFLARAFSYNDAQRYRLGANFMMLPINAPRCLYRMEQYDGQMNFTHRSGEVNFFPAFTERNTVKEAAQFPIFNKEYHGKREKAMIDKENNFAQPGARFRSWPNDRQERFLTRLAAWLNCPKVSNELKRIWLHNWTQCDKDLGARLAKKVVFNSNQ